jgi:hypothetical protein
MASHNATFTQLVSTPTGMSDCEFIQNLMAAAASYDDKQPYSIPEISPVPFVRDGHMPPGSYNSNSYVSGVIRRAGGAPRSSDWWPISRQATITRSQSSADHE